MILALIEKKTLPKIKKYLSRSREKSLEKIILEDIFRDRFHKKMFHRNNVSQVDIETLNHVIEIKSGRNIEMKQLARFLTPEVNPHNKKLILLAFNGVYSSTDPSWINYGQDRFIIENNIVVIQTIAHLKAYLLDNDALVFKDFDLK